MTLCSWDALVCGLIRHAWLSRAVPCGVAKQRSGGWPAMPDMWYKIALIVVDLLSSGREGEEGRGGQDGTC